MAAIRHQCMDKDKVLKYFHVLKTILNEGKLSENPKSIWNMDDTAVQLDKPSKVLAAKGMK